MSQTMSFKASIDLDGKQVSKVIKELKKLGVRFEGDKAYVNTYKGLVHTTSVLNVKTEQE